jgi:hypothetical protein
MKVVFKKFGLAATAIVLATQQSAAFAAIIITYGPSTTASIPTLSEWGMIGLSILLAVVAVYTLRNKGGGKPLASVILACALALGGFSGNKLIGEANAIIITPDCPSQYSCTMSNAAGGIVTTAGTGDQTDITNTSGVPQTITNIAVTNGSFNSLPDIFTQPPCAVGLVVQPAGKCYVFDKPPGGA